MKPVETLVEVEFLIDQEGEFGARSVGDKIHLPAELAKVLEKREIVKRVKTSKKEVKEDGI